MSGPVPGIRFFSDLPEQFQLSLVKSSAMRAILILSLLGFGVLLRAEDAAQIPYTAVVTGVVCQSCKNALTVALKKLPGVKEVEFAKGDKPGTQKLTFKSSSGTLSKSDAETALGDHAKEFTVVSFDRLN